MPGPKSAPTLTVTDLDGKSVTRRIGKTDKDHKTGKWARRQTNRHADPIREGGGKQFGKTR